MAHTHAYMPTNTQCLLCRPHLFWVHHRICPAVLLWAVWCTPEHHVQSIAVCNKTETSMNFSRTTDWKSYLYYFTGRRQSQPWSIQNTHNPKLAPQNQIKGQACTAASHNKLPFLTMLDLSSLTSAFSLWNAAFAFFIFFLLCSGVVTIIILITRLLQAAAVFSYQYPLHHFSLNGIWTHAVKKKVREETGKVQSLLKTIVPHGALTWG